MARINIKLASTALTPLDASSTYDTGGSKGAGGAGIIHARVAAPANEFQDFKIDVGFGTSGRTAVRSSSNALTPLDASSTYDTGGSKGAGGAGIIHARVVTFGVKILNPSGPPSATTLSPPAIVNAQLFGSASVASGASLGSARPSTFLTEVALLPTSSGGGRVTHLHEEIAFAPDAFLGRVTHYHTEVAVQPPVGPARVTRIHAEVALLDPTAGNVAIIAPTDGAQGAGLVPLLEIDLPGFTDRYCNVQLGGVTVIQNNLGGSSQEHIHFKGGVLNFGSVNREIDPSGRDFRVTEFQVDLDNSTGVWSQIKALHGLTGRSVRLKLGDPSEFFESFGRIYTGTIAPGSVINDTVCRFTVTDVFTSKLDTPVLIPVTEFSFPFLPESTPSGGVVPVIIGNHLADTGRRLGQMPGFLIDPAFTNPALGSVFRYAALQGEIEAIEEVYVKGVLMTEGTDYEIVTEFGELPGALFYTSDFITYIDFLVDPRDATASAEATLDFEVTFNARGLVDPASGITYTNPADALWTFMKKHTIDSTDPFNQVSITPLEDLGLQDEDFDEPALNVARLFYAEKGIECSFALFDGATTLGTVLDRFAESFGLMVTTNVFGKIQFDVRTKTILSAGSISHILQNSHIVANSFTVATQDRIISALTVNSDRDWILKSWYDVGNVFSADNNTRLLGESGNLNLWYVRDEQDRAILAAEHLFFAEENRNLVTLACDAHLFDDISLGDNIAVTHQVGPSTDGLGYREKTMKVLGVGFDFSSFNSTRMILSCIDIDQFSARGCGSVNIDDAPFFSAAAFDSSGLDIPAFFDSSTRY